MQYANCHNWECDVIETKLKYFLQNIKYVKIWQFGMYDRFSSDP